MVVVSVVRKLIKGPPLQPRIIAIPVIVCSAVMFMVGYMQSFTNDGVNIVVIGLLVLLVPVLLYSLYCGYRAWKG
jgi:multisubunit Na+/H+ antiporter MnhF subunit